MNILQPNAFSSRQIRKITGMVASAAIERETNDFSMSIRAALSAQFNRQPPSASELRNDIGSHRKKLHAALVAYGTMVEISCESPKSSQVVLAAGREVASLVSQEQEYQKVFLSTLHNKILNGTETKAVALHLLLFGEFFLTLASLAVHPFFIDSSLSAAAFSAESSSLALNIIIVGGAAMLATDILRRLALRGANKAEALWDWATRALDLHSREKLRMAA